MSPPSPPPNSPGTKLPLNGWGIALVVIGAIILLPCGLCTAGFLLPAIGELAQDGDFNGFLQTAGIVLFVGGAPSAFGGVLIFFGTRLRKSA